MTQTPITPKQRTTQIITIVIVVAVALGALVTYFVGLSSRDNVATTDPGTSQGGSAPLAEADPQPEPADTREITTFTGEGDGNSVSAPMAGDYSVTWETRGSCYYSADLESATENESVFSADAATAGTTNLYGLPEGSYHVEMITGPAPSCGWTITFSPV